MVAVTYSVPINAMIMLHQLKRFETHGEEYRIHLFRIRQCRVQMFKIPDACVLKFLFIFRVNAAESLFMQTGYMNLKAFDTEDYICTCGDNSNNTHELKTLLHCTSSKDCANAKYHVSSFPTTQCSTLGKVNTPNTISAGSPDVHTGTDTSFIPTSNIHSNTITQKVRNRITRV